MLAQYSKLGAGNERGGREDAGPAKEDTGPAEEDTGPAAEGHPKSQKDAGPAEEDTRSRSRTPDPTRPPMDAAQDAKTVSTKKNFFSTGLGATLGVRGIRGSALYRDKYGK